MKLFRFLVLLLSVTFITANAFAQDALDLLVLTKSDGQVNRFRWVPSDQRLDYTYKIYRKNEDSFDFLKELKMMPPEKINSSFDTDTAGMFTALLYPQSMYEHDAGKLAAYSQMANQRSMAFFMSGLRPELADALGVAYADNDIEEGETYVYKIEVYKDNELVLEKEKTVYSNKPFRQLLPSPKAKRYEWGIALTWTRYDVYSAFNVYRSSTGDGEYVKVNENPVTVSYTKNTDGTMSVPPVFYTDTTIEKDNVAYYYKVSGLDSFGDETDLSKSVFAIRDATSRPAPPLPLVLTKEKEGIQIDWILEDKENIKTINLFRALSYNGEYVKIKEFPALESGYLDTSVEYKKNYFYCHSVADHGGRESVMSLPRLAVLEDRIPPAVPRNFRAIARDGEIILEWDAGLEEDFNGVNIYRAMSPDSPDWAKLNDAPVLAEIFVDSMAAVLDKKPYYYKITAVDTTFNSSEFSEILEIKLPDVTPPNIPVWISAENNEKSVVLNWGAVNVSDLAGYNVYRREGNEKKQINEKLLSSNSFEDKGVRDGLSYIYYVKAVDLDGNESDFSEALDVKKLDKTAPKIGGIKLQTNNGVVEMSIDIKDDDFSFMTILKKRQSQANYNVIKKKYYKLRFVDKYVDEGNIYQYKVKVFDKSGNVSVVEKKVTT